MVPEITPRELAAELAGETPPRIVDVREAHEFEFCRLASAELRPLGQIRSWMADLDPEADMVLMCHSGFRSGQAVMYLRSQGFKRVRNLRGGIDAWSVQVDPNVPRY
jgi:adenylyltransferase/sulfurtransferase